MIPQQPKKKLLKKIKFPWHLPYLIASIGLVLTFVFLEFIAPVCVITYIALRGSLFTGFFTVSGFLMSAKSLIILNMNKEVYATDDYLDELHNADWESTEADKKNGNYTRSACGANASVYRQLIQMGTLLTINIALALVTSFTQITIGFSETNWSVAVCLSLAFATALLLGCSVLIMWQNFEEIYARWEKTAQKKLEARWAKSLEEYQRTAVKPTIKDLPVIATVPVGTPLPLE